MATSQNLNKAYKTFIENVSDSNLDTLLKQVQDLCLPLFKDSEQRTEAEDLTQDIMLYVWQSVDPRCPLPTAPFQGKSSFSTWLGGVINNRLMWSIRDNEEYISVGSYDDLALLENGD